MCRRRPWKLSARCKSRPSAAIRGMAIDVNRLTPQRPVQPPAVDAHRKAPKQHAPDGHFIDDGVEPLDERSMPARDRKWKSRWLSSLRK